MADRHQRNPPAQFILTAHLMTLALLFCCASPSSATGASPADPIKIGAVLPFSGGVELYGGQMNMFLARTKGGDLVTVRALGTIAPEPRCP